MIRFEIKQAQRSTWDLLEKSIKNNKIGSAYLFSGSSGVGKEAMAIEFGATINRDYNKFSKEVADANYLRFKTLQHELLKLIFPLPTGKSQKGNINDLESLDQSDLELVKSNIEQKSIDPFHKILLPNATRIRINSIRELRKSLYLKSDDIGRKIVLIFDAHLLTAGQAESANALLKILEEPPSNTTIILVTDNKNKLLPTILSRCQHIDIPPLKRETIRETLINNGTDSEFANLIADVAQGDLRKALSIANDSIDNFLQSIQILTMSGVSEDGKKWRDFINDNSMLARNDMYQLQQNIFLLQVWFQSVFHLRIGVSDSMQRPELLDYMQEFNKKFPTADLHKINILLENTIDAVGRNLHMSLFITNLLINIQKNLK